MASVDFTAYTEKDDNGKLTVAVYKVTAVDADSDEDVYLYDDRGVDFFNALDIDFEILIESTSLANARAGISVANVIGSISDQGATDISVVIVYVFGTYAITLQRGNGVVTDSYVCSADTVYYCTLSRAAGNDTVTLDIYTDKYRTVNVDTLTVNGFGVAKWRYIYGFINRNTGTGGEDFDGYIRNMRIATLAHWGFATWA